MSRALLVDLQIRVLAAIAGRGLSHRAAGERFGVSAASVSRWRALERSQGDARPKAWGGNRRSGRVDACKSLILSLLSETPDITIEEIRRLPAERGHIFGFGSIQRFFQRHTVTRKKDCPRQRAGSPRIF